MNGFLTVACVLLVVVNGEFTLYESSDCSTVDSNSVLKQRLYLDATFVSSDGRFWTVKSWSHSSDSTVCYTVSSSLDVFYGYPNALCTSKRGRGASPRIVCGMTGIFYFKHIENDSDYCIRCPTFS